MHVIKSDNITNLQLNRSSFNVADHHNGSYIGLSEIRLFEKRDTPSDLSDIQHKYSTYLEQTKFRLDTLVEACCGFGGDRHPFVRHKEQLIADLSASYALFHFVQSNPEILPMLRDHEVLENRAREIPKSQIALLCVHCIMIPETDDEQKLCSDWTIWLEQADHNKIFPDKFVAWAMDQKFHLCRDEVRARRRHAKTFDGRSPIVKELKVQLSIRETKGGVSVMLNRQEFSISKNVFDEVLSMIERVASEGLLNSDGNSAAASRPVLKIFSDGS